MNNNSNKGKLKITKEQYNRIFASGLINEEQVPKIKGGLNRVDKEFKKYSLKEGEDQLKTETIDLIKYLYRKSDDFSPFWAENDLTYDDICDALCASKLVVKKDGGYELCKSLGSPEKAIKAVEEELRAMLGNDKTPKDELEEGDWFDYLPNHPANQADPQYSKGTHIKNPKLQVVGYNGEFAFVKGEDGILYAFYYDGIDRDEFLDYVDREIIGAEPDGEGGYDNEYSDEWDIDDDVLSDYINDNISGLKVGEGLDAWESGDFDLVKIDNELRQDFLEMYDKDPMVTKTLGGLNENETEDEKMARIKAVIAQRRADSQKYEDEYFKRRDAQNRLNSKNAEKQMKLKDMPEPVPAPEPKKPVGQYNMFGGIDEMGTGGMGGTNTQSVGGQFTPSLSTNGESDIVKKTMPNVPVVKENMDVKGAGDFQYDTPGGLTMDLGKNNPKTKAEKKTQWAGGAFVDFNDCVKMNNKPAGTGCSAGAVDNVVKLKKTKGNVNAPSLGENKIYEAVAKKTGKTIDEVKAIITAKNAKG